MKTIAYIDGGNLYHGLLRGSPADLRFHATYCYNIPRDLPARCQLPDVVPLPNGRTVHRPPAWR